MSEKGKTNQEMSNQNSSKMSKPKTKCQSCGKEFKNLELHVTRKHTEVKIDIHDDGTGKPTCLIVEYRHIGTSHECRIVKYDDIASSEGDDFYEFAYDDGIYQAVYYYPKTNKIEYKSIDGNKLPNWTGKIYTTAKRIPVFQHKIS
jgi:hypothetical protein